MKVIGIDVGLASTGYAVIENIGTRLSGEACAVSLLNCGVCKSSNKLPLSKRLKELYEDTRAVMVEEKPQIAVYESVFYKQNLKTLSLLAQVRGVLLLAAEELGIKVEEYTPAEIKLAICGNGRASKPQIQKMVEYFTGVKIPPPSDIADACACALCYCLKNHFPLGRETLPLHNQKLTND